jgi:hypothetical protein
VETATLTNVVKATSLFNNIQVTPGKNQNAQFALSSSQPASNVEPHFPILLLPAFQFVQPSHTIPEFIIFLPGHPTNLIHHFKPPHFESNAPANDRLPRRR